MAVLGQLEGLPHHAYVNQQILVTQVQTQELRACPNFHGFDVDTGVKL